MGRVSQNYSRGKHSPSFTGKSNHSKQGAGERKNSAAEEEVSSVVESWGKRSGEGRSVGMVGQRRKRVSDPFLSDVTSHSLIYNKQLKCIQTNAWEKI